MLTPLDLKKRRRKLVAYDLEWYPESLELRLVGCYDERGYRPYTDLQSFMDAELTQRNRGRWFFAHYGGRFDFQFLYRYFEKRPEYSVRLTFSGSSAVIVKVKRGRFHWTFCDSSFLLKVALYKIGKHLGLPKGKCAFDAPLEELIPYNKQDCKIVFEGVQFLQDMLLRLGGELRPTISSCAMALFRARYLKRPIQTSAVLNDTVRSGYVASRVEPHRRIAAPGSRAYDYNSSFPWSMTGPLPGSFLREVRRIGASKDVVRLIHADVSVPDSVGIPPLPHRDHKTGRIFFPVGRWSEWFGEDDLAVLEESGGCVERVEKVYEFETRYDLADYIAAVYEVKRSADSSMGRQIGKYLANAGYGKFAEKADKQVLLINPPFTSCPHDGEHLVAVENEDGDKGYRSTCMELLGGGLWLLKDTVDVPHAHVPIAMVTTARSRALLWRGMVRAENLGMVDTDCIHTTSLFPTSDKLGEFKEEYPIASGLYVAPKLYAIDMGLLECSECAARYPLGSKSCTACDAKPGADYRLEQYRVRAKGFRRLTFEEFHRMAAGETMAAEQMRSIRYRARRGDHDLIQEKVLKSISHVCDECGNYLSGGECLSHPGAAITAYPKVRPKRRALTDTMTVPWHVDELREPWGKPFRKATRF